jgi:hypothetical protein
MSLAVWLALGLVALAAVLVVGFRVAIRKLRRFVRAFWPHS